MRPQSLDTDPAVEERQLDAWRRMRSNVNNSHKEIPVRLEPR